LFESKMAKKPLNQISILLNISDAHARRQHYFADEISENELSV